MPKTVSCCQVTKEKQSEVSKPRDKIKYYKYLKKVKNI